MENNVTFACLCTLHSFLTIYLENVFSNSPCQIMNLWKILEMAARDHFEKLIYHEHYFYSSVFVPICQKIYEFATSW